jgi:hypothetical protein
MFDAGHIILVLSYTAIGAAFGCALLPFAEFRPRTLDHWFSFAFLWPAIACYYTVLALRAYLEAWGDYQARQKHQSIDRAKH